MNLELYKEKTTDTVINMMIEFIEEWDCADYTREDVAACEGLIHHYLESLAALDPVTDEAIMEQVKALVLALNDLNEATDYGLIETEAREAIWAVIQESAVDCGLQDVPDDVTEEWRDW